ncbi:hypothetical protein D1007_46709 [Hordeum vulgare]|nr:hypothetical protein D1007_46709 [Hordeum vulgare]
MACPPPPEPELPPHLYNFQAWLAAQGLQVQDGLVPEDNISNIASQVWNDAITTSEDADSPNNSSSSLTLFVIHPQLSQQQHSKDSLMISIDLHIKGIRFGISDQGETVLSLLLTDPVPMQQLNDFIFRTIRPIIAYMGPWLNGYGFKHDVLRVGFQVSLGDEGLSFNYINSALPSIMTKPSIVIEELSPY